MTEPARPSARVTTDQIIVGIVLALSVLVWGLHVVVLRPFLWPAGAGIALSADVIFGQFAERHQLTTIRPPDLAGIQRGPVTITRVWTGGAAEKAELHEHLPVYSISGASGAPIDLSAGIPDDPQALLRLWRAVYDVDPRSPVKLSVADCPPPRLLNAPLGL